MSIRLNVILIVAASLFLCASSGNAQDRGVSQVHRPTMCSYGVELPANSQAAIRAKKIAWDYVVKVKAWSPEPRPQAAVCDLVWMLVVDYRADNPTMHLRYVTIDAKNMEVVQVFTDY